MLCKTLFIEVKTVKKDWIVQIILYPFGYLGTSSCAVLKSFVRAQYSADLVHEGDPLFGLQSFYSFLLK